MRSATLTVESSPAVALASLTLQPPDVTGGATSTGVVTLTGNAPTGGTVVALSSNNTAAATVPASVTVPALTSTTTFTVTTNPVAANATVAISATYAGVTKPATLIVRGPSLSRIDPVSTSIVGGETDAGTVYLTGNATAAGATVQLTSNNPSVVTVPATVSITPGYAARSFGVTTQPVATSTPVTITASYNGVTRYVTLTITPSAVIRKVNISERVVGGLKPLGAVILNGDAPAAGMTISLSSSNPAAASVPASVQVAAGSNFADFQITTTEVTADTPVAITATYQGAPSTANTMIVNLRINSVQLSPSDVPGGQEMVGTVTLNRVPQDETAVYLTSSHPTLARPTPKALDMTTASAQFRIETEPVATDTTITISASFGDPSLGPSGRRFAVSAPTAVSGSGILRAVSVSQLYKLIVVPTYPYWGETATGTVVLSAPAPAGGTTINLSSSNPTVASVPPTVVVPQGATQSPFPIPTSATQIGKATITATLGAITRRADVRTVPVQASISHYVTQTKWPNMRALGCAAAQRAVQKGIGNLIVYLHFFGPRQQGEVFGTMPLGTPPFRSNFDIRLAAQQFGIGSLECDPTEFIYYMMLAVGTTNKPVGVVDLQRHGKAWAQMIEAIQATANYAEIGGGNDIEMDWGTPDRAKRWLKGFDDEPSNPFPYVG